ncbi:MAG: antitoxin [Acidimicrobiia bacterium]
MSRRLQVLLDEREWREIRRTAKQNGMTVSEWVRQALRTARRREPLETGDRKLDVIRAAAGHSFPTADIDEMLAQVEAGYLGMTPR